METSAYWIEKLGLVPHPEGGWFRETYRSSEIIPNTGLPERFSGDRSFCTAIYFLLERGQFSALHRIKSDELWFFHTGGPLSIHWITDEGLYSVNHLGSNPGRGESLQVMVPAGCWFGAQPLGPAIFSLASCTVAPGFDFSDFALGDRDTLISLFSGHRSIIEQLTRRHPLPTEP